MSVKWCTVLPQWIVSSDRGAYHPATRTIYIRRGESLWVVAHECVHWLINVVGGGHGMHRWWDRLYGCRCG